MSTQFDVAREAIRSGTGGMLMPPALDSLATLVVDALTATGHLRTEDRPSNVRAMIAERTRQDELWGEQNHPDGTGNPEDQALAEIYKAICQADFKNGKGSWRSVLLEEVFEAVAESGPEKLRTELVQVAAVVLNWLDCMDRREQWRIDAQLAAALDDAQRQDEEAAHDSLAAAEAVVAELRARLDTAEQWSKSGVTAQAISQAIEIIERTLVAP